MIPLHQEPARNSLADQLFDHVAQDFLVGLVRKHRGYRANQKALSAERRYLPPGGGEAFAVLSKQQRLAPVEVQRHGQHQALNGHAAREPLNGQPFVKHPLVGHMLIDYGNSVGRKRDNVGITRLPKDLEFPELFRKRPGTWGV